MKNPSKKKRDWLEQIRKEGLTKKRVEEEDDPNVPRVTDEGLWLWRCFSILNARRQYGRSGPQPISLADIHALSVIEEYDKAESRWLCEVIDALDRVYIEETYDKLAKEQNARAKKGSGSTSGRRR